jgi:uncharacterized protein (TIGR02147 family)
MDRSEVYNFSDPIEFVSRQFSLKREKNPRFSLRSWSQQLGFKNPSYISNILKGHRRLQLDLAGKISKSLKLSSREKKYFELLILCNNTKSAIEKSMYLEMLNELRPEMFTEELFVSVDAFRYISDWYHVALIELIATKNFRQDINWITKRLGKGLTAEVVSKALERLVRLNLIEKKENGYFKKTEEAALILDQKSSSDAIRLHHQQMMEFGMKAINDQRLDQRDVRTTTISMKLKNYKEAQDIIRKAHMQILELAEEAGEGEEVYVLSSQFFQLTENQNSIKELT